MIAMARRLPRLASSPTRRQKSRPVDHRREDARTDWDREGLPNREWEALLGQARNLAVEAGLFSYPFPREYGGRDGSNLGMAIIREHLPSKGLGLHCDLQNEHAIVGNNIGLLLMLEYGSDAQKAEWVEGLAAGKVGFAMGITEPDHGSDATDRWKLSCDGGACFLEAFGEPARMISVCADPDDANTQMAVMLAIGDDFDERLPGFIKGVERFRAG